LRYLFYFYIKKSPNNYFVTLTNGRGNVRLAYSAGKAGILGKKKKKAVDSLRDVLLKISSEMLKLGISNVYMMYFKMVPQKFLIRLIIFTLAGAGVHVRQLKVLLARAHNGVREAKQKRL
jgi:ribosomal protein S11